MPATIVFGGGEVSEGQMSEKRGECLVTVLITPTTNIATDRAIITVS